MRITLIQVEIEAAIRAYVNNQLAVREGHRIDIDLKATRGDEGYQAFIDIVPEGSETQPQAEAPSSQTVPASPSKPSAPATATAPAATATPVQTTRRGRRSAAEIAAEAAQNEVGTDGPEVEHSETVDASAGDVAPMGETTAVLNDPPAEQDQVEQPEQAEPAGEPAPARKSLFGGLSRPVNS